MNITTQVLTQICPDLPEPRAAEFAPFLMATMTRFDIVTKPRAAAFLAQAAHESGQFRQLVENLNYSADGLRRTWPTRFDEKSARLYERQPERIANYVYAGRLGNGPESSGDGWRFRGRGIFQLTFRNNYGLCSVGLFNDAGVLLANPEKLEQPEFACLSAGWFWNSRGLNKLTDAGDFKGITERINGGHHGLKERIALLYRAEEALS